MRISIHPNRHFQMNLHTRLRARVILLVGIMLLGAHAARAELLTGRVLHVTDGDTFILETGGDERVTVRVAEIDAPEGDQPFGAESRLLLAQLIDGKVVQIAVKTTDDYGRTVGRPFTALKDVSSEMVRAGAAWAYRQYLTDNELLRLESEARASRVGLWAASAQPVPPWDWRHQEIAVPSQAFIQIPDQASTRGCNIKGNISSNGEHIYHLPGQRYYGATQINGARGERWFCNESDARAAGWRRSRT